MLDGRNIKNLDLLRFW